MLGTSSMYITLFENTVESFIDDLRLHIDDITTAEIVDYKTTKLDSKPTIDVLNKVREVKFTVHGLSNRLRTFQTQMLNIER